MSTLNIADKQTMDTINTDVTYVKNNLPSGSASPVLVIKNTDSEYTGVSFTVSGGDFTQTVVMPDASNVEVAVPYVGEYTISFNDGDWTVQVLGNGKTVTEPDIVKIVSWATGTDEEIVALIAAADAGKIDLVADAGWAVGDTREVSLSAMTATGTYDGVSWSVGESHVAQTIELVLMDGGATSETGATFNGTACSDYTLVTSVKNKDGSTRTNPAFIVGMKNILANGTTREGGYMNSSNTNTGSWNGCSRRYWCNGAFRQSIPSTLRPIFKQFNVITAQTYSGSTNQTSQDYFALFAAKEIFGGSATSAGTATGYSNLTEFNTLKQLAWYATSANRIKKAGTSSEASYWWCRSPYYSGSSYFCGVSSAGGASVDYASSTYSLAPFGCI